MANKNQGTEVPEISVDLNAADPTKAVTRRAAAAADIAADTRETRDSRGRSDAERTLFKRMNRLEKNLAKQFDQRMAEREAEWQRERSELQSRLDKVGVDRDAGDKADEAHDAAIAVLKAKLEAAYERGDSKESSEITLQISKLDAQYWAKKAAAAGVATRETADPNAGRAAATPAKAAPRQQKPTAAGSRFITANEDWWEDPEYDVETSAANTIYLRLVTDEGFDPKSDETFKEVAVQLKKKFPTLDVRAGRRGPGDDDDDDDDVRRHDDRGGDADGNRGRRQAAAANLADRGGDGGAGRHDGGKRSLTAQDRKTMTDCRLDPDNDRDVVQFLREAQALERASA